MSILDLLRNWFMKTFLGKNQNTRAEEHFPKLVTKEIKPQEPTSKEPEKNDESIIAAKEDSESINVKESKNSLLLPKEIFQSWKIDFSEYKPFFPNWGDLDPTVSIISDGRERKDFINFLYDEFVNRYGNLTTDLGYGLIYSIVMNAIEKEDRSISSALREAIVRSNDPLLCVAVVKDYCQRKAIQFDKYEKITLDILKKREAYYNSKSKSESTNSSINFTRLPALPQDEQQELNKSSWLFNATLIEIYPKPETKKTPLYLMVKIPTLKNSQIVRGFNPNRYWRENQNVVVQWDGEDDFRVLDFK